MNKTEPEQLIRNAINSLNSSLSSIGSEDIREEFSTDESDSHAARPKKLASSLKPYQIANLVWNQSLFVVKATNEFLYLLWCATSSLRYYV